MQLMFSTSEEAPNRPGLSLIPGQVLSFNSNLSSQITNTGFKSIYGSSNTSYQDTMYFTHSYFCQPTDSSIITSYSTFQGLEFCASFVVENLIGLQFHPEKSGQSGLKLLKSLLSL